MRYLVEWPRLKYPFQGGVSRRFDRKLKRSIFAWQLNTQRVQPLPERCEVQLPRLPRDWRRVILSGRIILLDPMQWILDILELND